MTYQNIFLSLFYLYDTKDLFGKSVLAKLYK